MPSTALQTPITGHSLPAPGTGSLSPAAAPSLSLPPPRVEGAVRRGGRGVHFVPGAGGWGALYGPASTQGGSCRRWEGGEDLPSKTNE